MSTSRPKLPCRLQAGQHVFGARRGGRLGTGSLAYVMSSQSGLERAVIAFEGLLARQPDNALALARLAEVHVRRKRLAEASACLERAESLAGATALTSRLRGDIAYQQRRYADAARAYRDAVALGDEGTWSLVGLARSYAHAGDASAAKGAAAQAAERAPSEPGGWLVLGEIALAERRFKEAEEFLARAQQVAPADKYCYAKLVEARVGELAPDAQVREVQMLLKTVAKGNVHLQRLLAKLQKAMGRPEDAAETLSRAVAMSGDLRSRKDYALTLKRAGRLDEAARALAQCLADDPEDQVVFTNYVKLQKSRGALGELRATLEGLLPAAGKRYGAYLGELKKIPTA